MRRERRCKAARRNGGNLELVDVGRASMVTSLSSSFLLDDSSPERSCIWLAGVLSSCSKSIIASKICMEYRKRAKELVFSHSARRDIADVRSVVGK
jgi:hypothetical protein